MTVSLSVGNDVIQPILEAKIQAAIVAELGKESSIVEQVVTAALSQKVERERYGKSIPFLQKVCEEVIQKATREAVEKWAESHKEDIANELVKQMRTKKFGAQFVQLMLDGMANRMSETWRLKVEFPER